jgi:glycerol-3-phosphate dehydrogenase (NAD(P)+)
VPLERVTVIGAGAWGTALAAAARTAGRTVTLLGRDEGMGEADLVLLAVPAQASRQALSFHADTLEGLPVVLTAKGLEHWTLKRQSEVLRDVVPGATPYVLSGPSFAVDVAAGRPTAVTLAGDDAEETSEIAAALAGPGFRPYAADDRLGVELAGALKNVYALGCGAVEGAGLGASARSALLARGFAEMTRMVVAMGGSATTLAGLAGLGDLTLTCTSVQSRNYRYGMALGRGEATDAIGLAEGVSTAPVAQALAANLGIEAPLVDAINQLLKRET